MLAKELRRHHLYRLNIEAGSEANAFREHNCDISNGQSAAMSFVYLTPDQEAFWRESDLVCREVASRQI